MMISSWCVAVCSWFLCRRAARRSFVALVGMIGGNYVALACSLTSSAMAIIAVLSDLTVNKETTRTRRIFRLWNVPYCIMNKRMNINRDDDSFISMLCSSMCVGRSVEAAIAFPHICRFCNWSIIMREQEDGLYFVRWQPPFISRVTVLQFSVRYDFISASLHVQ